MQAVILAGGAGTRLRSIVSDRPKSMAPFDDKPFLEYQIEALSRHGITEVVLCVGYLREHVESHFEDGRAWGVRIVYSRETQPLGTGGALRNARALLRDSFLLLNGDSYLDLDVRAFADAHVSRRKRDPRVTGTLALTRVDDARAYGSVEMDSDRRIVGYREKCAATAPWISAGVYALEPSVLNAGPAEQALSLERDVLPSALARGDTLLGHPVDGFFVDIGTPEGHARFRKYIEGNGNGHSQ